MRDWPGLVRLGETIRPRFNLVRQPPLPESTQPAHVPCLEDTWARLGKCCARGLSRNNTGATEATDDPTHEDRLVPLNDVTEPQRQGCSIGDYDGRGGGRKRASEPLRPCFERAPRFCNLGGRLSTLSCPNSPSRGEGNGIVTWLQSCQSSRMGSWVLGFTIRRDNSFNAIAGRLGRWQVVLGFVHDPVRIRVIQVMLQAPTCLGRAGCVRDPWRRVIRIRSR